MDGEWPSEDWGLSWALCGIVSEETLGRDNDSFSRGTARTRAWTRRTRERTDRFDDEDVGGGTFRLLSNSVIMTSRHVMTIEG